jgi:hypothetical protein
MYAGFKRIAPDQDTGMDLNEPWIPALELFNPGGGDLRGGSSQESTPDVNHRVGKSVFEISN